MADKQTQLLALPSWYAYTQQPDQVAKELSVQLHLLASACTALSFPISSRRSSSGFCGFLLVDRVPNAIKQGDEKSDIDSARDARAVLEVERGEVLNGVFEPSFGDAAGQRQL